MTATSKKKEFGLAAQLTQPRPAAPAAAPEPEPPATTEAVSAELTGAEDEELESELVPAHSNHPERSKRSTERRKKVGAPPRAGGYVRRTITLAPAVSDYVDRAWRTHRTPEGKYVKGVSGFIEAILEEHRRRGR